MSNSEKRKALPRLRATALARYRALSLVLALCLLIGIFPGLVPDAGAVFHSDNAPAASAELLKSTKDMFVTTPGGGMLRVVDGQLYYWGANIDYCLGTGDDSNVSYPSPTLHPCTFDSDPNQNYIYQIKKVVSTGSNSIVVLTEKGNVYVWGANAGGWFAYRIAGSQSGKVPAKINNNPNAGKLVDVYAAGVGIIAKDENGKYWVCGSENSVFFPYRLTNNMEGLTATQICTTFQPISERFIDRIQTSWTSETETLTDDTEQEGKSGRKTIAQLIPSHGGGTCFIVTSDERMMVIGDNNFGQNFLPDRVNEEGVFVGYGNARYPVNVLDESSDFQADLIAAFPRLETLNTNGYITTVLDAEGSVWMVGSGQAGSYNASNMSFWDSGHNYRKAAKVYDAAVNGAKCVQTYLSQNVAVFLCDDNSLYAMGRNTNQFITLDQPADQPIRDSRLIFEDISAKYTITGVFVTDKGVMVVDSSGKTYYAGDNSSGTAGDGTKESPENGEIKETEPENLPPVKPMTENKMWFEIELANGNRYTYDPNAADDTKPVLETTKGGATSYKEKVEINAGQICKLNVYFRDFGRINEWVLPIRYNPKYVKIVNGSGVPYSSTEVVTPGAIGESTGIVKGFTNQTWPGGVLVGAGSQKGGYPMICNGEGWASFVGYTEQDTSSISGTVKMFSVNFAAQIKMAAGATEWFDIASQDNVGYGSSVSGVGYDYAYPKGAEWQVFAVGDNGQIGHFDFTMDEEVGPCFWTDLKTMKTLGLTVQSADGTAVNVGDYEFTAEAGNYIPDAAHPATGKFTGAKVAYTNKTSVYTIHANYEPADTSFPQLDWSYEVVGSSTSASLSVENLVTIVNVGTTGDLRFQVSSDYPENTNTVVKFTAQTQKGQTASPVNAEAYVILSKEALPQRLEIREKKGLTDVTVVYDSLVPGTDDDTQPTIFHVDFPDDRSNPNFNSTAVVWTLYDASGNAITSETSDPDAALGEIQAASGHHKDWADQGLYTAPNASINLYHTTFGTDKLTLRVASAMDPTIYDEIYIKIHRQVLEMGFNQTQLYMAADSSRDIRDLLSIGPENDYYEANLKWTYVPQSSDKKEYLYLNDSVVTAGSEATRNSEGIFFEQIFAEDTISGKKTTTPLQIAIISVESPIKADAVEIHNLIDNHTNRTTPDYAKVSGLEEGDTIIFTKTFSTAPDTDGLYDASGAEVTDKIDAFNTALTNSIAANNARRFNVTRAMLGGPKGSYEFPLPYGFLKSEGGDVGFIVIRHDPARDIDRIYDKVPVSYGHEPSKVYGYIRLEGKKANSAQNAGIEVQIMGISTPEKVYTNQEGYFIFNEYIVPGTYTMIIHKEHYLRRVIQADVAKGYNGIVIEPGAEFAISTYENPIYLYPGDLDGNGAINTTDIQTYVRNWLGQRDYVNIAGFATYDFFDGAMQVIDLDDLNYVARRNGYVKESYANWYVPTVK